MLVLTGRTDAWPEYGGLCCMEGLRWDTFTVFSTLVTHSPSNRDQIRNFYIFCQHLGGVTEQPPTHDIHPMVLHTTYHTSLRYRLVGRFISIHHGGTTLPNNVSYIVLHLAGSPSISMIDPSTMC